MVVTRSTPADRRRQRPAAPIQAERMPRRQEAMLLGAALLAVLIGCGLLYGALSPDLEATEAQLARGQVVDLRAAASPEPLLPFLGFVADSAERRFVAERIARQVASLAGKVPNIGELARIRVPAEEVSDRTPDLAERLGNRPSVALLDAGGLAALKPHLVVRTPGELERSLGLWAGLLLAGFVAVHLLWRARGFRGDELLLPTLALLAGLGLLLAVSFRDPLRDLALHRTFVQGVLGGLGLMLAASFVNVERSPLPRLTFSPLLAAIGLSVLLILFGRGPGTSDAKVNLLGVQPVEAIKILVVLFLASYFLGRWEFLRELAEERAGWGHPALRRLAGSLQLPRLQYALPPIVAIAVVLFFFFLQRDLGPALVLSLLFLLLYGVARGRALLPAVGLLLVGLAFFVGYKIGYPRTVTSRIAMWVSPWDNPFRGGDHLAQSLWAMAGGGATGTGLGLGQPGRVPEVHTDAVLAGLGEEMGFAGLAAVFALYALLVQRGIRAAVKSGQAYGLFLGLGLTLLLALNVLLIAGGVTGVLPLSGVVTPFLSTGRSAMLANFLAVGLLAALSAHPGDAATLARFRPAVRALGVALAVPLALILGKLAWVQLATADDVLARGALTLQGDGQRRFTYNPRLADIAATIPRGAIVDRNGLPLATSNAGDLARHKAALARLGANVAAPVVKAGESARLYPLGGLTFHLLGDVRNRVNWSASNTSYAERDRRVRLQGYDDYAAVVSVRQPDGTVTPQVKKDYRELIPLLRHRQQPNHRAVRAILDRDRTLRLTIDARLQVRAAAALRRWVEQAGGGAGGAAVVLDARSGELLASVSYPWPQRLPVEPSEDPEKGVIDRARYGIYPPGSTFKLVTAMAALRRDPAVAERTFECVPLPEGRVGHHVRGWGRPVRDDPTVTVPHGDVDLEKGIRQSCNAYFAQLAVAEVGAASLLETARLLGITMAKPNTPQQLGKALPQAAYGQGQVIATPLQMTRVAATVAAGGVAPEVRWYREAGEPTGPGQAAASAPVQVLPPDLVQRIARAARGVVTEGTAARFLGGVVPPIAGKTGTAEVAGKRSHSWFIGFAPYGAPGRRIAVGVIVEHGGYGGRFAAPAAGEIVRAAADLGIVR